MAGPAGGNRILVVDDNRELLDTMKLSLEDAGYEVFVAGSGQEALALTDTLHPDLAIVDLFMPGMSGSALIAELHRRAAVNPLRIVAMSGVVSEHASPAKWYLAKPFDVEHMLRVVKEFVKSDPTKVRHANEEAIPFWKSVFAKRSAA